MRILVTGGAGFICGHLAERFVRDGHDVVLDNFDPFYDTQIKDHTVEVCQDAADTGNRSYRLVEGDVRDAELVGDVEYVYHQTAQAGVRPSMENPRKYDEVNVDGTLNLLDAVCDSGLKRFVMASSSSVYGKPQYLPYNKVHPTISVSPYSASKLAAERYACSYSEVYDMSVVALRYLTVYDPRMRPNMVISNFVSRCLNGESLVVYEDGTQTRDFTFIEDIVEANVTLLSEDAADGEAFNIGSTDNIEILTLTKEIRDQIAPELEFAERHDTDAEHTHDSSKAREMSCYEPTRTIREGVEEFIDWYRANRE
jgi:UDP-glucose 4-epimerase